MGPKLGLVAMSRLCTLFALATGCTATAGPFLSLHVHSSSPLLTVVPPALWLLLLLLLLLDRITVSCAVAVAPLLLNVSTRHELQSIPGCCLACLLVLLLLVVLLLLLLVVVLLVVWLLLVVVWLMWLLLAMWLLSNGQLTSSTLTNFLRRSRY